MTFRIARVVVLIATVGGVAGCGSDLELNNEEAQTTRRGVLLMGTRPVVEYTEVGDEWVMEGDILLDASQLEPLPDGYDVPKELTEADVLATSEQELFSTSSNWKLWPNGVVPYTVSSSLSSTMKARITQAIEHLHSRTSIRFVPRTGQADYVTFRPSSAGYAYASVGKVGGQQFINLVANSWGVILHEMGHTIGLLHEHTRPDRDQYVKIYWNNIRSGLSGNFQMYSAGRRVGAYDPGSFMHYPSYEFSRNGSPTILTLSGNTVPAGYKELSTQDVQNIQTLYGFTTTTPTPGQGVIVDSNNGRNDTNVGYVEVSSAWLSSDTAPGFYGTGYWYAWAGQGASAATFWFYVDQAGTKTIDLWWSTYSNRSVRVPVIIASSSGELGRVEVNQKTGGASWAELGTWSFPSGWNKILVDPSTADSGSVVADAVRIR